MNTNNNNNNNRLKGVIIQKPIVYGNIAFPLGKKAEEGKTHNWVAYIRGLKNEDISYFIKKVIFTLHPSFPNSKRTIEKFPFEIYESGWGEFEISIRIFFVDSSEKPIDLYFPLKLYPPEGQILNPQNPVISENYDELIFNSPREEFYKILIENEKLPTKPSKFLNLFTQFNEERELKKVLDAQQKIKNEIKKLKDKYELLDDEFQRLTQEINRIDNRNSIEKDDYGYGNDSFIYGDDDDDDEFNKDNS